MIAVLCKLPRKRLAVYLYSLKFRMIAVLCKLPRKRLAVYLYHILT